MFQQGGQLKEWELVALGLVVLVLQELVEQQAFPRKEPEEELKEQVPLPILPRKKEVPVVLPQRVLERVPQELGEE